MRAVPRGLLAGFLATGPMTYALMQIFESLPAKEKSPLPPATITDDLFGGTGLDRFRDAEIAATMGAHFGYGATVALPYSFLAPHVKAPAVVKGAIYGVGVWGASYLGLLPTLGVRSRAPNMPMSRNAMMIAAHIVWGAALGIADEFLEKHGNDMFHGARKAPAAE